MLLVAVCLDEYAWSSVCAHVIVRDTGSAGFNFEPSRYTHPTATRCPFKWILAHALSFNRTRRSNCLEYVSGSAWLSNRRYIFGHLLIPQSRLTVNVELQRGIRSTHAQRGRALAHRILAPKAQMPFDTKPQQVGSGSRRRPCPIAFGFGQRGDLTNTQPMTATLGPWAFWLVRFATPDQGVCRSTSKSSFNRHTRPFELLAILEPPPEPTTTLSGVVPGFALYDTPSPNLEPQELIEQSLSQRHQRVKTPTEKGNLWSEAIKQTQDRSAKIHRTKARRASRRGTSALNDSNTDGGYTTAAIQHYPLFIGFGFSGLSANHIWQLPNLADHTSKNRKVADHSESYTISQLNKCNNCKSRMLVNELNQLAEQHIRQAVLLVREAHLEMEAQAERRRLEVQARAQRAQPPPNSFDATARATTESEYTYIFESLDPGVVAIALERFVEYDCSELDIGTLKAMYQAFTQDCAAPVEPPEQQAEVVMLSPSPIKVGGSHHRDRLQITGTEITRSAKRSSPRSKTKRSKRQRVTINTNNTDPESDSPPSETSTESEPTTEVEIPTQPSNISRSPSPHPFHNTSIDPFAPGYIDYPHNLRETLSTTQSSTQVSQPSQSSTRPSRARAPTLKLTSSFSLGQPPRADTQTSHSAPHIPPQPSASKQPTPSRQPRSGILPRLQRAPPPGTDLASLRRSAKHKVQARRSRSQRREDPPLQSAAPSRPRAPHAEALRHEQSSLLRDLSKDVRAAREIHRRQELASTVGLNLEDIEPGESERESLADALLPDNQEQLAAAVAEEAGELPIRRRRRRKPSARDLFGYERQVVSPAKMLLLAHTLREGPFQTRATFTDWAGDIWLDAWRQELPHVTPQAATEIIRQILVNALATGRGRFKDSVRPLVQYKLGFIKPALTDEDINHNLRLFRQIHPNTFHCTEFSPPYGHYESDIVTHAIAVTLFGNSTAIGVEHREMFNPMPLTTSAFMLALVQFCIEEYETGQYRARDLNMSDMLNKYVAHLRGLKEARAAAKTRITRLQKHWFDYGYEYSGATLPDELYDQPITLRSDVRPDTPQPEIDNGDETELELSQSELEAGDEHVGMSKGKGRAC
ncbi:hypothetical protein BDV93DRAFT_503858 [Ceratobasidium sp. AG-I]|nr:hypothetical protein BDV93DRAFT_503858 [Ceratobasidium sp. AG-I]